MQVNSAWSCDRKDHASAHASLQEDVYLLFIEKHSKTHSIYLQYLQSYVNFILDTRYYLKTVFECEHLSKDILPWSKAKQFGVQY